MKKNTFGQKYIYELQCLGNATKFIEFRIILSVVELFGSVSNPGDNYDQCRFISKLQIF